MQVCKHPFPCMASFLSLTILFKYILCKCIYFDNLLVSKNYEILFQYKSTSLSHMMKKKCSDKRHMTTTKVDDIDIETNVQAGRGKRNQLTHWFFPAIIVIK